MAGYRIKADGINANTEPTVAIAKISYEVENAQIHQVSDWDIKGQFKRLSSTR